MTDADIERTNTGQLDRELLKETWRRVRELGDLFPQRFYGVLLITHPELIDLFPASLAAQRTHLMAALNSVVLKVDKLDDVVPVLTALGRDHRRFGAEPAHYDAIRTVLLDTLQYFLQDIWNGEVEKAWTIAYDTVADVMKQGAQASVDAGEPPWWSAAVSFVQLDGEQEQASVALQTTYPYPLHGKGRLTMRRESTPGEWVTVAGSQQENPYVVTFRFGIDPDDEDLTTSLVYGTRLGDQFRLGPPLDFPTADQPEADA